MQTLLSERQVRAAILALNAEATKEAEQGRDLAKRLEECNDRQRSLRAQFDGLRTLLREWYGKDVAKTGTFPFIMAEGESI